MKRITTLVLATTVVGCGTTLPNAESLTLAIAAATVSAGEEVQAVFVNESDASVALEFAPPCGIQINDQVARDPDPVAWQDECDASAIYLRAGTHFRFNFRAPTTPGHYRIALRTDVRDPQDEFGTLVVQSRTFTVIGPERPEE